MQHGSRCPSGSTEHSSEALDRTFLLTPFWTELTKWLWNRSSDTEEPSRLGGKSLPCGFENIELAAEVAGVATPRPQRRPAASRP